MKRKVLTSEDKDAIIQRIAQGEHMAYIAKDLGMDKGNLSRSLQRHNKAVYRQSIVSKMQNLEQQAAHNLITVNSNEDRKRLLRVIKHYRCALSKYEPTKFSYVAIPRQNRHVKPAFDKVKM